MPHSITKLINRVTEVTKAHLFKNKFITLDRCAGAFNILKVIRIPLNTNKDCMIITANNRNKTNKTLFIEEKDNVLNLFVINSDDPFDKIF